MNFYRVIKYLQHLKEGVLWGEDADLDKITKANMDVWLKRFTDSMKNLGWSVSDDTFSKGQHSCTIKTNFDKLGIISITSDNIDLNKVAKFVDGVESEGDYLIFNILHNSPKPNSLATRLTVYGGDI